MYYITKKDSETGKKFQAICQRMEECWKAAKELVDKYGVDRWRGAYWVAYGGISSVDFDDPSKVDLTIWRKNPNESVGGYLPRKNVKKGKEIFKDFEKLPTISVKELNMCIGWDENINHIGLKEGEEYFGFATNSKYKIDIPEDCEEITETQYNNIK